MGESTINKAKIEKSTDFRILLSEKQYIKDLLANIITRFGDGIDTLAFALLVYEITGSKSLLAITFGISGLPNILFGVISGVITSYFPKKYVIFICDFGRGFMVIIISLLYINNKLTVPILFIITFINSSFESFRAPASISIKPYILKKENLDLGMSLNSSCLQLSQVIGIASAPLIISLIGISGSLLIDAFTFFLCSFIIITLKYLDTSLKNEKITLKKGFFDFKMGFKFVIKNRFIFDLCIFCAIVNALFVPIDSLSVAFVSDLNLGPEGISIMQFPLLIAMFFGGLIYPILNKKIKSKTIFMLSGSLLGIIYFLISLLNSSNYMVLKSELGILCFFLGLLLSLVNLPISISAVTRIDEEYLSKVSGIMNAFALAAIPITSFIVGIIIEHISTKMLFGLFGIITSIVFLIQIFNKNLDELNN